jgi:D-galactose 1-dehydrogenase
MVVVPLKIAIVGLGNIALEQHLPAIQKRPDCWDLVATVSCNSNTVVEGIPNYESVQDCLRATPDLEVVSLYVPPVPRFDTWPKSSWKMDVVI